ncbi:MAG: carotenoid 1,2-hydratase [Rhodovarius sp.]|nr:carotenoid 1,2-hydratase [Rhodovarius sp.]MCX7931448.1 carotenoid 1,2-hydratase [Rhodovarius sp.]MDW8314538.1 carotenoid 1,2-hydratase [Rhodovarius sp.]
MPDDAPSPGTTGWEFDRPVPMRGYRWWYVDALSEDGQHGITIIAMIGAVFSPWYAWARRGGGGDPLDHCSLNVALYGRPRRWAMTDRRSRQVTRSESRLAIGPSSIGWDGSVLTVEIAEITAPLPSRLRGLVRVRPRALSTRSFALDAQGKHIWHPIAARAWAEVEMDSPRLSWAGPCYFDSNWGAAPLEEDFRSWDWCRAALPEATAILYNPQRRDGTERQIALRVADDGSLQDIPPPPPVMLPPTRWWRIPRPTRSEGPAEVIRTLEDTPFYARSVIGTRLLGQPAVAVHESIAFDRFASLPVQALLPVRVPRPLR